ncbi:hypothetical protein BaRGS_00010808 [Batillaria attramentaria]|uniref:Uncharacterized protein n=1 Tax=Batillaria attramentaria TaxID=370345 RepID=A0ABD0LFV0_9CAEN
MHGNYRKINIPNLSLQPAIGASPRRRKTRFSKSLWGAVVNIFTILSLVRHGFKARRTGESNPGDEFARVGPSHGEPIFIFLSPSSRLARLFLAPTGAMSGRPGFGRHNDERAPVGVHLSQLPSPAAGLSLPSLHYQLFVFVTVHQCLDTWLEIRLAVLRTENGSSLPCSLPIVN